MGKGIANLRCGKSSRQPSRRRKLALNHQKESSRTTPRQIIHMHECVGGEEIPIHKSRTQTNTAGEWTKANGFSATRMDLFLVTDLCGCESLRPYAHAKWV